MIWTPDEVLAAVRTSLSSSRPLSVWVFEGADLDGDQVIVRFMVDARRYGARYSLDDLPAGPNTGIPCATPERWAFEVGWDVDEQVETGGVARAERAEGPDDLVLLRWV